MIERIDQTVVAISSAPGRGAVGIVRLSGPQAHQIGRRMGILDTAPGSGSRRGRGQVTVQGVTIPAVFYLFHAPHSYTRQDMVEIHTLGNPVILEMVRQAALDLGATAAQPGEFTARAFFGGAMDLVAAEGVARLIRAQTDTQLAAARRMMEGTWSKRLVEVGNDLAEVLGLVEAGIDFAEEPIEFITPRDLAVRLFEMRDSLQRLVDAHEQKEIQDPLPRILLLGPPNAGKSSLMNRLSGSERAITAPVAGTTRDVLSAQVRLGKVDAVLLDAAGIDESPDEVIAAARSMVRRTAGSVDLICVVLDARAVYETAAGGNDRPRLQAMLSLLELDSDEHYVVALNKSDLCRPEQLARLVEETGGCCGRPVGAVSALHGTGIDDLKEALTAGLGERAASVMGEAAVFSGRQKEALGLATESIEKAADLAGNSHTTSQSADLLAFELREALNALGTVTGEVTTEDLLTQIFANFCIGK